MSKEALIKAIALANGQAPLARGIRSRIPGSKIGQVHVWGWLNSVKMEVPPAEAVIAICATCEWKITPHELRLDIYPNELDGVPVDQQNAVAVSQSNVQPGTFTCGASDPRHGERQAPDFRSKTARRKEAA